MLRLTAAFVLLGVALCLLTTMSAGGTFAQHIGDSIVCEAADAPRGGDRKCVHEDCIPEGSKDVAHVKVCGDGDRECNSILNKQTCAYVCDQFPP